MNIKSILMSSLLLVGSITASAQEEKEYEYVFNPHWYVGLQPIGAQYTLGEVSFSDLLSYNMQVMGGYNFSPVFGARLGVSFWQSKGGLQGKSSITTNGVRTPVEFEENWKYNYIAPNVDLTVNLSNLFCGYNPERPINVGAFVGIGLNCAFNNSEAQDVSKKLATLYPQWVGINGQNLVNLWDGSKFFVQGRAGLMADYQITPNLSAGIEVNANVLSDKYNSKDASNADWYFNALAGVKYTFGKTHTKRQIEKPQPVIVEKIVEKIIEKPVEKAISKSTAAAVRTDSLRLDIFFTISGSSLTRVEELKVQEIAIYLKNHPGTKVQVTGYADKGTGSEKINMQLSEKRANAVVNALKRLGIDESRISSATYKGDTEQPFDINELNRVSICIIK